MAKGYGRSLDLITLLVLVRDRLQTEELQTLTTEFDKDQGFTAWFGAGRPDAPKWFETLDSSWLALLIGAAKVPGVADDAY